MVCNIAKEKPISALKPYQRKRLDCLCRHFCCIRFLLWIIYSGFWCDTIGKKKKQTGKKTQKTRTHTSRQTSGTRHEASEHENAQRTFDLAIQIIYFLDSITAESLPFTMMLTTIVNENRNASWMLQMQIANGIQVSERLTIHKAHNSWTLSEHMKKYRRYWRYTVELLSSHMRNTLCMYIVRCTLYTQTYWHIEIEIETNGKW